MSDELLIPIVADADLVTARAQARAMALALGFSKTDATLIATAISEIARNILVHAGNGEVLLRPISTDERQGLAVLARDEGPGIRDLEKALLEGQSGRDGFGLGLPGARRLMDEFDVACETEKGTIVTMTKWRTRPPLERLNARRVRDA